MKRNYMPISILFVTLMVLFFCAVGTPVWSQPAANVVASTAWTGAYARFAGAAEVTVLAPFELRHPPEYELKPTDIAAVTNADLILFAGYEVMVSKLKQSAGSDAQLIRIATGNNYSNIETAVLQIAAALGTEAKARQNLTALRQFYDQWREELQTAGLSGIKALVHFHQRPLAQELGFQNVGTFGPGPLEAKQIMTLSKTAPELIIDNWHNPVAQPLTEILTDIPVSAWANFPNQETGSSLMDLLQYNRQQLRTAWQSAAGE